MQKLLKSSEVMEVLGVCKTTFWKLVNDGGLPVVECGKLKRWRPEVVEQFIESHTKGVK